jgi:hemerythrin-like domain-containing protein
MSGNRTQNYRFTYSGEELLKPTEILMREHTIVLKMLEGAERLVKAFESTHQVDASKVEKIIYSHNFTDSC